MGVSTPEESKMMKGKVLFLLLVLAACALATQTLASAKSLAKARAQAKINNQELREAMEEAGDTDSALDWTNKELQMLAMAENRLEAAKEDVHEAQTAKSAVKRAQLEDLAEELSHEAVTRLEETKDA